MDWRLVFNHSSDEKPLGVGKRLGVPYTRTLLQSLEVKLENSAFSLPARTISIEQDGMGMIGISGVVWDAGLYMVDYLCSCSRDDDNAFAGSPLHLSLNSVLDIGCGTGICGIAALALGASQVVFTDAMITDSLDNNVDSLPEEQKSLTLLVKWKWSVDDSLPAEFSRPDDGYWDTVLCSDVLYDNKCLGTLQSFLRRLRCRRIVFAYKRRHEEYELEFFSELEEWCTILLVPKESIRSLNLAPNMVDEALHLIVAFPHPPRC